MRRNTLQRGGGALPDGIAASLMGDLKGLAAGALLPSERELTERFKVSRAVVREALARLRSDGLITARQGKGAFVAERGRSPAFRIPEVALDEKGAQTHIIELLIAIEVAASRLAAERRTPDELKRLRKALVGIEYAIASDSLGDEQDYEFHQAIVDATHNPHFKALSDHLEHGVRRLIRNARSNTARNLSHLMLDVQREHQAIYDAIEAKDPAAAARAAETHLRNAAKRLDMYLSSPRAGRGSRKSASGP